MKLKKNKRNDFFEDLKESLEEVLAHRKGEIELEGRCVEIPEPPKEYKAKDIKKIRKENEYSQSIFARILNVSTKTVQSWESGNRNPSQSALRMLEVVDKGIYPPKSSKCK